MRSLLAHQRRLRCAVRPRVPPPPLPPDALGQRRQLAARLLTQFREAGGELVKRRERPGGIPAQRAGAHQQLRGRLRVWLQCKRAPGPLARARLARCSECLLTRRDQRGGRPSTVPVPLLCSPFLERGRALYGEALEKIAQERDRYRAGAAAAL